LTVVCALAKIENLSVVMFSDLLNLFYPLSCKACRAPLLKNEYLLCGRCYFHLPFTNYHRDLLNPVFRLFWGRVPLEFATSYLHFRKGGRVQQLLHALKYEGATELGEYLGSLFAGQLKEERTFEGVDSIIPVPLHAARQRQRGYNQSELFARGLSAGFDKPVVTGKLLRLTATETQTRKSRFARYENTREVFSLREPETLYQKHVLLVDDVVTTGATLEACAQLLTKDGGCRLSMATIAAAIL
jgi:ComF family protein